MTKQATLKEFTVGNRIDSDNFHSSAIVVLRNYHNDTLDTQPIKVDGQYNARTNTWHPMILGDPYELEDWYEAIQAAVEKR